MEWISIKDRFPENLQSVLVLWKYDLSNGINYYAVAYYNNGMWLPCCDMIDCDGNMYLNLDPKFWMPLPEPPKGE